MSNTILKFEDISKQYRLGLVGTGTISHDLNRWWYRIRGKEDPYLKIGQANDRATKGDSQYVWALKDINLEVNRGDVLGIIGKNGAGKSTLLKILSKVTSPTTGVIKSKGRIASLLEVGTGFHPELTGRENIYLNGAILGMTKSEIVGKLDEIVDFSGCERYVDTPVKRYSSGMKVRLAFAVAAHLEPEILVVDEVLAVGDAEFQKKAIGKMQDISKGGGRTVLFVSHNMSAVKRLCSKSIVLDNGNLMMIGDTYKCIEKYLSNATMGESKLDFPVIVEKTAQFTFIQVRGKKTKGNQIRQDEEIEITGGISIRQKLHSCMVAVAVWSVEGFCVFTTTDWDAEPETRFMSRNIGQKLFKITIPKNILFPGRYFLRLGLGISGHHLYDQHASTVEFEVSYDGSIMSILGDTRRGMFTHSLDWDWN